MAETKPFCLQLEAGPSASYKYVTLLEATLFNMERHIFELLWPFFGFCQYLGLFPCKRTIDTLSGLIQLKPIHWMRQLAFFLVLGHSIMFGNMVNFIPIILEGKSTEDNIKCLRSIHPINESLLDWMAMLTLLTSMSVLFYLLTWGIVKTKTELCDLFHKSDSSNHFDVKKRHFSSSYTVII